MLTFTTVAVGFGHVRCISGGRCWDSGQDNTAKQVEKLAAGKPNGADYELSKGWSQTHKGLHGPWQFACTLLAAMSLHSCVQSSGDW